MCLSECVTVKDRNTHRGCVLCVLCVSSVCANSIVRCYYLGLSLTTEPRTRNAVPILSQVWALDDVEWECRIDEGAAGTLACAWMAPYLHWTSAGNRSGWRLCLLVSSTAAFDSSLTPTRTPCATSTPSCLTVRHDCAQAWSLCSGAQMVATC